MKPILVVALLLVASPMAVAQEDEIKKSLATCAALENESTRLDCYDQLAQAAARVPTEAPEAPESKFKGTAGKWSVASAINPVDDSRTVVLALVDDADSLQLIFRCQQGKPEIYVNAAKYLGSDSTQVLTRIGDAKAETKRWPVSLNHKAVLYPGDPGTFIKRLLTIERLVVQVNSFSEGPITAVFKLGRLPDVVAPLKEACRLPL
jgi:hypothetical protein